MKFCQISVFYWKKIWCSSRAHVNFPHIANHLKRTDFCQFLLWRTAKLTNCASIVLPKFAWKVPLGCHILKFWVWSASSWPKRLQEPKFQLSSFKGGGCRLDTNFFLQWRVTDGNFFSLKSCFLAIKSPKTWKSAIKIWCASRAREYFHHISH
jgi:hypothetical protein